MEYLQMEYLQMEYPLVVKRAGGIGLKRLVLVVITQLGSAEVELWPLRQEKIYQHLILLFCYFSIF